MSDEELHRPYQKLREVQNLQEQNYLIDMFANHWKNKFKHMPIFPVSNAHFTQMKDFRKAAGPNAALLIEHYFEMKDEWFIKQAYSLDCLVRNVNKVAASFGLYQHSRKGGQQLQLNLYCDYCWDEFMTIKPLNFDFNKLTLCKKCESEGRTFKYTTKEERLKAVMKFGKAFIHVNERK